MYLNCHTYHSLRYGTLTPEELVAKAFAKKIEALALTDINNVSCAYDFVRACRAHQIRPLIGIEFRSEEGKLLFIGIARNNKGFAELNHFFSKHSIHQIPFPERAPSFENAYVLYRQSPVDPSRLKNNEFIGVAPYELPRLHTSSLKEHMAKLVMLNTITFSDAEGYETHCLLRAIDQNTLLSQLNYETVAHKSEVFYEEGEIKTKYEAFPEIIANTKTLVESCSFDLDLSSNKNKKHYSGSKQTDVLQLEKLAYEGFSYRYEEGNQEALARLEKELKIIADLNFLSYFLITNDIVSYARSKGYHHIGRGSGANSIVAYCLRITDVDPMELDLYFERFINPHRHSPPDFDIDFCWDERDDVIRYIFERFGSEHVGLLATYSTFGEASIIREIGKIYGLTKQDIDVIADEPELKHKHHPFSKKIFAAKDKISGFPNHLGIHAGGIIITDDPIFEHTALQRMSKGFPIVQFDMNVAEENGFFKFDMLSQRGLGHIKEAVQLIRKNKKVEIDIHRVSDFKKDPKLKEQLRKAKTIGCFYIESPAMRGLITKLRCEDFLTLVAASSIIRPGVAKSGMMREYIKRFQNPETIEYLHPKFKELLEETFGVMVYQEDVIKIAHYFAGLDLSEADILRRTMSGKSRAQKELEAIRDKFFSNCKTFGYPENVTTEVWRQIESFSGFSFCKAHSASYAVESYQSLFLKTYYPLEFIVAVINNSGGFYDRELYVHEARMAGARIEAPCVNNSMYTTSIEGSTIYLGFVTMKDLEEKTAKNIIRQRQLYGPYQNMEDFVHRTGVSREQLILLIRAGSLRFTGQTKQELLWQKNNYLKPKNERVLNPALFNEPPKTYALPMLEINPLEEVYEQIDLFGFPLVSPFDLLKTNFRGEIMAAQLKQYEGKTVRMVGYFVARKQVRTVDHRMMNFGTWVDHEGNFFDSTHFPDAAAAYPFRGKGCYLLLGKVTTDFGFPSLEVEKMAKLEMKEASMTL